MVRGPATTLLRISSSRKCASRFRIFTGNRLLHSVGQYDDHKILQSNPLRPFSTIVNQVWFRLLSQSSRFGVFSSFNVRRISFLGGPEEENEDGDSVSSSNVVEVGGYNADVGKSVFFENDTSDSMMVTREEDECIRDSICGSIVDDSKNGDDNDLRSSKPRSYENIRSCDPVELYSELRSVETGGAKVEPSDLLTLREIFHYFLHSGWASNQALGIYIGMSFFPTAVSMFRSFFFKKCSTDVVKYLVFLGPSDDAVKFLFPIFVEYCLEEFPDEIKRFQSMVNSADLTKPHTWFPFARAMKRRIVYHCGPTNSGKTYNALQRFMEAKKGIYCSPLRLLAMEVFDKVNAHGVYCSLLTGQEKKLVPFSSHTACTVEMVSTEELYEIAVIDEIQMMSDPCRGFAWTRALLGLKADEIHLCGDPSVLNVVRKICSETGDELHEQHYGRFKPLVVEAKTLLGDFKNVRSGDCIVAFSRREIFEVKLAIEKFTSHRCCVIYGSLPPETRRRQASLFNDQDNEFDVLVASDAVGMGLNLNIGRVVFYNLVKFNGDKIVPVPASQVKQIAGRAGRRGSRYPDGLTTTFNLDDLDYLIECLKQPFDDVKKIGLFPSFEQVELFAGQISKVTFAQLLQKFSENCRLDGSYFLCRHDNIKKVANMLEKVPGLSLEDRYNFCFAPVNVRDPKAMYHLLRFASSYSHNVPVSIAMGMPKGSARNDSELLDLETKHQVLSMYLWLSQHFKEETFPYVKKVEVMATDIAELLGQSLTKANWKPESRQVGKPKPQDKEVHEKTKSPVRVQEKQVI